MKTGALKTLVPALLLGSGLYAEGEWDLQGYVGLDAQYYITRPEAKHPYNLTATQRFELSYSDDAFTAKLNLYAQGDSFDLSHDQADKNERSFVRLDEAFVRYEFENDTLMLGNNIRFWGALEVRNIADAFNPVDFRQDPSESDKMGVWNAAYTHYFEMGELSVIVKFYEPDQPMAAYPYAYYFLPPALFNPMTGAPLGAVVYDDALKSEKSRYYPSTYLKYSASTQWEYALDYAVIFEHGYDSQHYFSANPPLGTPTANGQYTLSNNVYLVNKILTYNTLVIDDALIKFEGTYTDVIDSKVISDYMHLGLGIEYTLTAVMGEGDLGLLSEYYYYDTFEAGRYSDLELFEIFEDDLFVGFRYTFNDAGDSSILAGALIDLRYEEQSYSIKYETRLFDVLKLKADYQYINPSATENTAYALMGMDLDNLADSPLHHQRVGLDISYYY